MGIYDRDYAREEAGPIRPWDNSSMVTMLIVANVVVFVATHLFGSGSPYLLRDLMILRPQDLLSPLNCYRLIACGFAHGGMMHLLSNMVGLYFMGQGVEGKLGKWEFFRFYMIAILVCSVAWAAIRVGFDPAVIETPHGLVQQIPSVLGASGAVVAVSMLFIFSFPHATLMLYGAFPVKAWVLGVFIILSNVIGNPHSRVAFDVHLFGAAFAGVYFYLQMNFASLGGVFAGASNRLKAKRKGIKVHRPDDVVAKPPSKKDVSDERESDRILGKISKSGKDSLTKKEQAFMEAYSRKVRKRRQQ